MQQDPVTYVRDEPPRQLWRSIVLGFGFAAGVFLFGTFLLFVA